MLTPYPRDVVYSRHSHQRNRAQRLFIYTNTDERSAIDAMRYRFGPVPLSQSLLVRTALATLQKVLATGYVPPIEDKLMLVDRKVPAELPAKTTLALRLAALAGAKDAA